MRVIAEAAAELAKQGNNKLASLLLQESTAITNLTPAERRKLRSAVWRGWSTSDKEGKGDERSIWLYSHEAARLFGRKKYDTVYLNELTDDELLRGARHVTRTFAGDPKLEAIFCKHGYAGCAS